MRLVTCNLLHGRSLDDGRVDTHRMVRSLVDLAPNVLSMQEVDRFQPRSHNADQVAEIAAQIPGARWRFVPAIMGEPGTTKVTRVTGPQQWAPAIESDAVTGHDLEVDAQLDSYSKCAYGTGLITTMPVLSWHIIRVRPFPLRAPVFIPGAKQWMIIDDEPRVCIAAVVEHLGRQLTVAATHASFVPGWNIPQLRQIGRALRGLPAPRILLGDLNLPAPLPAKVMGWRSLAKGLPTFPSPNPRMQLDHCLVDDPGARLRLPVAATAERLAFSDHRALIVDLSD